MLCASCPDLLYSNVKATGHIKCHLKLPPFHTMNTQDLDSVLVFADIVLCSSAGILIQN